MATRTPTQTQTQTQHKSCSSSSSSLADLLSKVARSCLFQPLAPRASKTNTETGEEDDDDDAEMMAAEEEDQTTTPADMDAEVMPMESVGDAGEAEAQAEAKLRDMEAFVAEVLRGLSRLKQAYIRQQAAHRPFDPQKLRHADKQVVAELRKMMALRNAFLKRHHGFRQISRSFAGEDGGAGAAAAAGRDFVRRRRGSRSLDEGPSAQLLQWTMQDVQAAAASLSRLIITLMKDAGWDLDAAARCIEPEAQYTEAWHKAYVVEAYVSQKMFEGFHSHTFQLSSSSATAPKKDGNTGRAGSDAAAAETETETAAETEKRRQESYAKYRELQEVDAGELLKVMPDGAFGGFCKRKYLRVVPPKMEEAFFGNLQHRCQVLNGRHPQSPLYAMFVTLAKNVWLLHKLAFALDPLPAHFQVRRGCAFQPAYMDNAVPLPPSPPALTVGFPITPGFKVGDSVIKARVYAVPAPLTD